MDPKNETTRYIESLPKELKAVISDPNIENRTREIAKKYSLSVDQEEGLIDIVMLILTGIESPDTLEENIISDLSVSGIVAEQIINDLDNRVFDYALKELGVEDNESKSEKVGSTLPEIRPDNLPAVETVNQTGAPAKTSVPVYTPKPKFMVEKEPVQSPVSVPRFKAVPMGDEEMIGQNFIPNIAPKPNASGIIESKLNSITKNIEEVTKTEPPKTYTKDPYREPIN